MDHPADVDAVRKTAVRFLQDLLDNAVGKPTFQTASNIVELAFDSEVNPLIELFRTVSTNDPIPVASPAPSLRSRGSRGFLGLGRRENRHGLPQGKAALPASHTGDLHNVPPGMSPFFAEIFGDLPSSSKSSNSQTKSDRRMSTIGRSLSGKCTAKAIPMSSSFAVSDKSIGASSSVQYSCIICKDNLSSKGVCKRHLEEQHVSPKIYKCEKCDERFLAKADAKKHCDVCGRGKYSYTIGKQDDRKIYGCEFTGEHFFSRNKYVEHLLKLCGRSDTPPEPDFRRKLCALLEQPGLRQHMAEISSRVHGSRHAWKRLQWNDAHLFKAIEQLEYAVVHDNGTIEFERSANGQQRVQNVRVYLNSLLSAGTLSRPCSSETVIPATGPRSRSGTQTPLALPSDATDSGIATPTTPKKDNSEILVRRLNMELGSNIRVTPATYHPTGQTHSMCSEVRSKRHLSDRSRFYVPERHPPGPPAIPRSHHDASNSIQDIPHSALSNTSTMSLPFRGQEGPLMAQNMAGTPFGQTQCYAPYTTASTPSSDAASGSTQMSGYQEPQLLNPSPFGYDGWAGQQCPENNFFTFDSPIDYGLPAPVYYYPDDASARGSSIATDQTYVANYDDLEHKLLAFEPFPSVPMAQLGTFLLDDDEHHDSYGMT